MTKQTIMTRVLNLIDDVGVGVLASVDGNCAPHLRWMTIGCIKDRPGALFMLSAMKFTKVDQFRSNDATELMIQNRALDEIANVKGTINIIENPSMRAEVVECIGPRLHAFWKANKGESEMVVLELVIESITYYLPMKGFREIVHFRTGGRNGNA